MNYEDLRIAAERSFDGQDMSEVLAFLVDEHPADIAHHLDDWPSEAGLALFKRLDLARQAKVFGYLDEERQLEWAEQLPLAGLVELVSEMNADERADLVALFPETLQQQLYRELESEEAEDIQRLVAYEDETAGAIMTTDVVSLRDTMTVQEALDSLRTQAPDSETIYRAYVVDEQDRLVGAIRLQNLIFARRDRPITELMESNALAVHVAADQEEVAKQIAKYDILAVPVVDDSERLVGMITHDDALDVVQEEATEDIHSFGAVADLPTSVREAPLVTMYRKRIGWLILLVFGALFSSGGIAYFEDTISTYVALVFFLPMLIGSAGNAGSQAATLMVRALALGDVQIKDWGFMIGRELLVALALGLTMAIAVSSIGIFRGGPEIAIVVATTMLVVVVFGSLLGMSLPFVLQQMRVDPATASAPLVATMADAGGVIIYFGIATAVLGLPTPSG